MNLPAEKSPRPSEAAGRHDLDFDEDDANDILDSLPDEDATPGIIMGT
jgi:hypothetical protein